MQQPQSLVQDRAAALARAFSRCLAVLLCGGALTAGAVAASIPAAACAAGAIAALGGAGVLIRRVRRALAGVRLTDVAVAPLCVTAVRMLFCGGAGAVFLFSAALLAAFPAAAAPNAYIRLLPAALLFASAVCTAADLLLRRIFSDSALLLNDGLDEQRRAGLAKAKRSAILVALALLLLTLAAALLVDRFAIRPRGEVFASAEAMAEFLDGAETGGYADSVVSVDEERLTVYLREENASVQARRRQSLEFFSIAALAETGFAAHRYHTRKRGLLSEAAP